MPRRNPPRWLVPPPKRYQPQTSQLARCDRCELLYTPDRVAPGELCQTCRHQPPLFDVR